MIIQEFHISERNHGIFPDLVDFERWKVNFKTEVCSKSADPHLIMHWIKEVEMAKSNDELETSRSIMARTDFADYDMLDAMIACAFQQKSKCRRVTRSKVRPILTNCFHDIRAFPCNWSL